MFKSREYLGISLEGEYLKIARVRPSKDGLQLVRLDKLKLVEQLKTEPKPAFESESGGASAFSDTDDVFTEEDPEAIFGFDDEDEDDTDDLAELDLSSIDEGPDDFNDTDLVQETDTARSNQELLVRYLDDFSKSKIMMSLNIENGNTIFQIVRDSNYGNLKKKEVEQTVREKLEAIYGNSPQADFFDYLVRDDGTLVIASIDEESHTLQLVNQAAEMFDRNYYITDVIPDESAMVGLYRTHYEDNKDQITGLIQFGPTKCRMIFVQGHEVLQVSPVINEGTNSKNFLNTIFSKILFQLDTGDIPGVDRLIVFNNTVGEKATDFFRQNFPDLICEEFQFDSGKMQIDESLKETASAFSTAIGIAALSANGNKDKYPPLSFLPKYVSENQKVFQLQWHGIAILVLIGLSPIILNHFYQQNQSQIDQLQSDNTRIQSSINELTPLVEESNALSAQIAELSGQLTLLTDLSRDNIRWTVTLDRFNQAVEQVGGLWINSVRQNNDVLMVDGYSLTRERIPLLANQFPEVTLLSVRREEIREREVFVFNMMIRRVVTDESEFTPERAREIDDMLNQGE
jgi:Tfp pilus assembly protein PilN